MKKVIEQEIEFNVTVFHEKKCINIFTEKDEDTNSIWIEPSKSREVALSICPELEQEKIEFAVGFSEWTNDLGKCDYYPSYKDVDGDDPVFNIWINRHNETDKKSTSELIELYKKVSHENN